MTIAQRKTDHIDLCISGPVDFVAKTTLLEHVELVHDALPELNADRIDTSVQVLGKRLSAPIVIAAMTGGTDRGRTINRELSQVAEERGYGFGLGSQRPMLERLDDPSYQVREVAPTCLLLGNLAGVQARELPTERVDELALAVGADGMCIHLSPAMELIQPGGDRDFTGVLDTFERLAQGLSVPVVAKETGCGISPSAAHRLAAAGVRHLDVSGAGGTSWVAVETLRASGTAAAVGETLHDWGVPTAASVAFAAATTPAFETIIATGGIDTGLDVARALALGAHAAGLARPVLQAYEAGGREAVLALFDRIEHELRSVMLLCGAGTVAALGRSPRVIAEPLARWLTVG
ncbi:MAG: type 2 isopentenyl-diphosphate Delta-isomerase [Deltaproteobacteria bacterium]|nr:type 2 isopentenyl-diphosphate Delta-isomerase [Deltaproteobacteria bacterium]